MKTYYEEATYNEEPIDWFRLLDRIKSLDKDSKEYRILYNRMNRLAGRWVTCACGNQCAAIPRSGEGEPLDLKLYNLGLQFPSYISTEDYDGAIDILHQIETRSSEILKKMGIL